MRRMTFRDSIEGHPEDGRRRAFEAGETYDLDDAFAALVEAKGHAAPAADAPAMKASPKLKDGEKTT